MEHPTLCRQCLGEGPRAVNLLSGQGTGARGLAMNDSGAQHTLGRRTGGMP